MVIFCLIGPLSATWPLTRGSSLRQLDYRSSLATPAARSMGGDVAVCQISSHQAAMTLHLSPVPRFHIPLATDESEGRDRLPTSQKHVHGVSRPGGPTVASAWSRLRWQDWRIQDGGVVQSRDALVASRAAGSRQTRSSEEGPQSTCPRVVVPRAQSDMEVDEA